MIVDFFRQFLTLFLILFLGFSFLNLFKPKVSFIEKISAGFMLGVGISTFGLFLLGFAGYSFNYWNVFTILLVGNLILVVANKFFKRSYLLPSSNEIRRCFLTLNALEKICLVGILFFVLSSLLQNLYWPIWMWDAVQLYDYRAKLIVSSQSIFFPARTFYDVSYPLLTSILHSVLYISGSTNPQYVYTLIFACLIGLVYSFIKENTSRLIAFVVSFFISFYPLFYSHSTQPLTNIVHSTYIVSSLFYLLRWFAGKGRVIDKKGKEIAKIATWYKSFLLSLNKKYLILVLNYLMQPSVFLTKKAYQKYGPFTGTKTAVMEYDLWLKLFQVQKPVVIPFFLSSFRLYPGSISTSKIREMMKEDEKIVKKYTRNPLIILFHRIHNLLRFLWA